MLLTDLINALQWWAIIFFIGIIFTPITSLIFHNFFDKGYIFSKIIGIALISYVVFILGFFKILSFETQSVFLIIGVFILINLFIKKKNLSSNIKLRSLLPIIILEEFIFISILLFWSFIHAHQPEIHGLEKYMDFGFINSILRTEYFPPKDMWLTPFYINYYYFGHLTTAVLTKISFLPSFITYNLMLSTIAGLSFVSAFSIGANLTRSVILSKRSQVLSGIWQSASKDHIGHNLFVLIGGILTAMILNFAGNLHTIYLFFKPYENEHPVPFWQLLFSPPTFPNSYWYPNATRFIENTIHEFPLYSYVVSDLHGHVLDIPFVLLTIAILFSLINSKFFGNSNLGYLNLFRISKFGFRILLLAFLLAIMYMTNAWDGIIYFILTSFVLFHILFKSETLSNRTGIQSSKLKIQNYILKLKSIFPYIFTYVLLLGVIFFLFTLPFNLNFKPFASGIGVLCAPEFLTKMEKIGPFLFEDDHCQRSPLWQFAILYGFFYFFVVSFIVFIFLKIRSKLNTSDIFVAILIIISTLLIIIPEFIYVKDIYPAHYRANTMFKLVYQSFILLSISCGYIITRIIINGKFIYWKFAYLTVGLIGLSMVFLYPYFATNSYFGDLKTYHGLDGLKYLKPLYPTDYEAILWINKNIKGQPVILEAQGDSYTDYGRVSTNTGLPTVLGWSVHEWLWRGTYDVPSPRIEEVQKMYESIDMAETKKLLEKYKVSLVFLGNLEVQKYPNLNERKFEKLGKVIFEKDQTRIYKIINLQ